MTRTLAVVALAAALAACAPSEPPVRWAIAIHGGAGTISRELSEAERREYEQALASALAAGRDVLAAGGSALDAVERVVIQMEDDPHFNAGRGAVLTWDGGHELDAAIMDGSTLACGAVAGVTTVRHPIALARGVMERTEHVFLAGEGAERLAGELALERVDNDWFTTPRRLAAWEALRAGPPSAAPGGGTVGAVALDAAGRLAAASSTGGTLGKRRGRIGDTPVIGAGTYADGTCAVSATGRGEEFLRRGVARAIALEAEIGRSSCAEAAERIVREVLAEGDGGVVVVGRDGRIGMPFNTPGMYRGAADAGGRFEVAIWDDGAR